MNKTTDEKDDLTTDTEEIQRVMRTYPQPSKKEAVIKIVPRSKSSQ